jgi:peptidoglycan/LPS O-acetylase OafA/YrhL
MLSAQPDITAGGASRRLPGIEAGRGIAAVLVILYHAVQHLDQAIPMPALKTALQFGHSGVDFFFVISGFIIFFVHARDIGQRDRIGHYARQRFTRLMPTYWVALALSIAMAMLGSNHGILSPDAILRSVTLLPSHQEPLMGVAWTLQYEVLFYLLFSLLIFSRTLGLAVLALWLGGTIVTAGGVGEGLLPPMVFGIYNLEFLFGVAAAALFRSGAISSPRFILTAGLGLFGLASGLENAGVMDGYGPLARFAYGIPSALMVLGLAEADRRSLLRIPSALRMLGAASYSLYLFHVLFIAVGWQVLIVTGLHLALPIALQFLLLVLGGILGGIVMWACVERPLIRCLRQPWGIRRRPLAVE